MWTIEHENKVSLLQMILRYKVEDFIFCSVSYFDDRDCYKYKRLIHSFIAISLLKLYTLRYYCHPYYYQYFDYGDSKWDDITWSARSNWDVNNPIERVLRVTVTAPKYFPELTNYK